MKTVSFSPRAFAEFNEWATSDREVYLKIVRLIEDISRQPFKGLGKPEPLKAQFRGRWSRRITQLDRLVYQVQKDEIVIFSCKEHY